MSGEGEHFVDGFWLEGAFSVIKPGITLSRHEPLPDSNLDVYGRFTDLASRYRGAFDRSTCNIAVKDQLIYELFRMFHGLLNLAKVGSLRTKDLWLPICAVQAAAVSAEEFEQTCSKLQGLVSVVPGLNSLFNLFGPNAIRSLQCTSAELVLGSLVRIPGFESMLETPEGKREIVEKTEFQIALESMKRDALETKIGSASTIAAIASSRSFMPTLTLANIEKMSGSKRDFTSTLESDNESNMSTLGSDDESETCDESLSFEQMQTVRLLHRAAVQDWNVGDVVTFVDTGKTVVIKEFEEDGQLLVENPDGCQFLVCSDELVEEERHCFCGKSNSSQDGMVCCDICNRWVHYGCSGLDAEKSCDHDDFFCIFCIGPSTGIGMRGRKSEGPTSKLDKSKSKSKSKSNTAEGNAINAKAASQEPLKKRKTISPLQWVACDKCEKWRLLPSHVDANTLPEFWECSQNVWNRNHNTCKAPEERDPEAPSEQHAVLLKLVENAQKQTRTNNSLDTINKDMIAQVEAIALLAVSDRLPALSAAVEHLVRLLCPDISEQELAIMKDESWCFDEVLLERVCKPGLKAWVEWTAAIRGMPKSQRLGHADQGAHSMAGALCVQMEAAAATQDIDLLWTQTALLTKPHENVGKGHRRDGKSKEAQVLASERDLSTLFAGFLLVVARACGGRVLDVKFMRGSPKSTSKKGLVTFKTQLFLNANTFPVLGKWAMDALGTTQYVATTSNHWSTPGQEHCPALFVSSLVGKNGIVAAAKAATAVDLESSPHGYASAYLSAEVLKLALQGSSPGALRDCIVQLSFPLRNAYTLSNTNFNVDIIFAVLKDIYDTHVGPGGPEFAMKSITKTSDRVGASVVGKCFKGTFNQFLKQKIIFLAKALPSKHKSCVPPATSEARDAIVKNSIARELRYMHNHPEKVSDSMVSGVYCGERSDTVGNAVRIIYIGVVSSAKTLTPEQLLTGRFNTRVASVLTGKPGDEYAKVMSTNKSAHTFLNMFMYFDGSTDPRIPKTPGGARMVGGVAEQWAVITEEVWNVSINSEFETLKVTTASPDEMRVKGNTVVQPALIDAAARLIGDGSHGTLGDGTGKKIANFAVKGECASLSLSVWP